eukprot:GDKI01041728.1.p1 GENE.GDKI01041728.1~~GDKI01041728.1.p1  ORF type:complete len:301 (-),score=49.69 GDKI01041728.1:329-1231(-)
MNMVTTDVLRPYTLEGVNSLMQKRHFKEHVCGELVRPFFQALSFTLPRFPIESCAVDVLLVDSSRLLPSARIQIKTCYRNKPTVEERFALNLHKNIEPVVDVTQTETANDSDTVLKKSSLGKANTPYGSDDFDFLLGIRTQPAVPGSGLPVVDGQSLHSICLIPARVLAEKGYLSRFEDGCVEVVAGKQFVYVYFCDKAAIAAKTLGWTYAYCVDLSTPEKWEAGGQKVLRIIQREAECITQKRKGWQESGSTQSYIMDTPELMVGPYDLPQATVWLRYAEDLGFFEPIFYPTGNLNPDA